MRKPVSTSNRRVAAFDSHGSERIDLAKATFDPQLPITSHRQRIIEAVSANQVVIVCGETGSGKSTQLPKMLLHAGCGRRGMIGQTQPRRLAARSVAQRIAAELDVAPGREVGYSVRFSDVTSPHTVIRIMTDGVLLAEQSIS